MNKSNYSSKSDDELLVLLKSGDEMAFKAIYGKYWKKLYAEASKRLPNTEVVEELVQDIFTDLWVKRESKEIMSLNRYLLMCARYQVFAVFRKTVKNPQFEEPVEETAYYHLHADSMLDQKELKKYIELWLQMQPAKRREIFRLKHMEELTTAEIAERLNISQKTVQNQLITSHDSLKIFLKKINLFLAFLTLLIR